MKLYALYTKTHEKLKDEWFLSSIPNEFELHIKKAESVGGRYGTEKFASCVAEKSDLIISVIKENMGDVS